MALTVGGSGESFVSVADADTFWTKHAGGTNWATANTADKEKALREATQFIDKSYDWRGTHPGSSSQLLSWPRNNVVDRQGRTRTGIPDEITDATAWLAEQALAEQLRPAKARGGRIASIKAGSVQVEYADGASPHKSFEYVDLLVSPLVKGASRGAARLQKV